MGSCSQTDICLFFVQDGTHRITPGQFEQVFITMFKYGDKWIPGVKSLLPSHTEASYRLQNEMIKFTIGKMSLEIKMRTLMSDFETAIQTAAQKAFPWVELRGCRFHFAQVKYCNLFEAYLLPKPLSNWTKSPLWGFYCFPHHQAVWRHAEGGFGKILKKSPKFVALVYRCLALPFILLNELQAVVDDLKGIEMEDEVSDLAKIEFLNYIQSTWIDGAFNPETWSCFGRRTDFTNNAQESYNKTLNRWNDIFWKWFLKQNKLSVQDSSSGPSKYNESGASFLWGAEPRRKHGW